MDCPSKHLRELMPLVGLGLKGSKLVSYLNELDERISYATFVRLEDMNNFEGELKGHVLSCSTCRNIYTDYIKEKKGEKSLRETDRNYLGLLTDELD